MFEPCLSRVAIFVTGEKLCFECCPVMAWIRIIPYLPPDFRLFVKCGMCLWNTMDHPVSQGQVSPLITKKDNSSISPVNAAFQCFYQGNFSTFTGNVFIQADSTLLRVAVSCSVPDNTHCQDGSDGHVHRRYCGTYERNVVRALTVSYQTCKLMCCGLYIEYKLD